MNGTVEQIFICPVGGASVKKVAEVLAVEGQGLKGDRYCLGTGTWPEAEVCQVTLIRAEDLDQIKASKGLAVSAGEHRRNIVVRGLSFDQPEGLRMKIGDAILAYDRPRPPCKYLEGKSQLGMMAALGKNAGHCFKIVTGGLIREGDRISILPED